MPDESETNKLLREIRDLLAYQIQMSKENTDAAKVRLDTLAQKRVESEGKFIKKVNQNAVLQSIWIAIVAAVAVTAAVNWK